MGFLETVDVSYGSKQVHVRQDGVCRRPNDRGRGQRWVGRRRVKRVTSGAGSDERCFRGRLGGSDAGVAKPGWRGGRPAGVDRWFLQGGRVGSRRDPSDDQVSLIFSFCDLPALCRCRSFYSGCCGLFVPDDLTAFMTHHAVAPLAMPVVLVVRRAPAGGGCRP
ncbi:hypothetical protein BHE74_00016118 [Ensete ventricosum]|nr:hypothetical protein BHE74_00016118 [Ensete ventricosum]